MPTCIRTRVLEKSKWPWNDPHTMPMRVMVTHQHHAGARRVHPDGSEEVGQSVCLDALPLRAVEVACQREQRGARVNGLGLGVGSNGGVQVSARTDAKDSKQFCNRVDEGTLCGVCVHLCEEETVGG